MKYEEALSYISNTNKFGEKSGLSGIMRLCEKLGNPQDSLKYIHIAGTNGKGSTATYIAEVLKLSGYKTGLFTSPFIYEFNERIKINGQNISDDELARCMTEVKLKTDELIKAGYPHPTEFEIITATAFLYYNMKKCDIVVLEVGLGGRFDSTNIIKEPLCSVICTIGYDHMQYLGDTLSEIAFEKCGIIKENCPVVCYPYYNREVTDVIKEIAKDRKAPLICVNKGNIIIKKQDFEGSIFDFSNIEDIQTSLCGEHQVYNAAVAIEVINVLKKQGFEIDEATIKKGIKDTKWPARMEKLLEDPCVIFDGAHNLDGMQMLVKNINKMADEKRKIVVLGMVKDKDYKKCIELLDGVADVLITTNIQNPRGESAQMLIEAAENIKCIKYVTNSVKEALKQAFSVCGEDSIIFSLGSLYMANEVKNEIVAIKSINEKKLEN